MASNQVRLISLSWISRCRGWMGWKLCVACARGPRCRSVEYPAGAPRKYLRMVHWRGTGRLPQVQPLELVQGNCLRSALFFVQPNCSTRTKATEPVSQFPASVGAIRNQNDRAVAGHINWVKPKTGCRSRPRTTIGGTRESLVNADHGGKLHRMSGWFERREIIPGSNPALHRGAA
jgi:hypothetical protein